MFSFGSRCEYIPKFVCPFVGVILWPTKQEGIWRNPPYLFPHIRIRYVKETIHNITNAEIEYKQNNKINLLDDTQIALVNQSFLVKHVMTLIMVDGKLCTMLQL